jgi:lipid-A-disaccharide synthase
VRRQLFALPNILASEELVPELIQHEVTGTRIADEVCQWLDHPDQCAELKDRFTLLHEQLKIDAASTAARVVLQHIAGVDETG